MQSSPVSSASYNYSLTSASINQYLSLHGVGVAYQGQDANFNPSGNLPMYVKGYGPMTAWYPSTSNTYVSIPFMLSSSASNSIVARIPFTLSTSTSSIGVAAFTPGSFINTTDFNVDLFADDGRGAFVTDTSPFNSQIFLSAKATRSITTSVSFVVKLSAATTTIGSTTVYPTTGSWSGPPPANSSITGPGIPPNTIVVSTSNSASGAITLSNAATATSTTSVLSIVYQGDYTLTLNSSVIVPASGTKNLSMINSITDAIYSSSTIVYVYGVGIPSGSPTSTSLLNNVSALVPTEQTTSILKNTWIEPQELVAGTWSSSTTTASAGLVAFNQSTCVAGQWAVRAGGATISSNATVGGTWSNNIQVARYSNGALSAWRSGTKLPGFDTDPAGTSSSVILGSIAYAPNASVLAFGGSFTSSTLAPSTAVTQIPTASVYTASFAQDGTMGAWSKQNDLPTFSTTVNGTPTAINTTNSGIAGSIPVTSTTGFPITNWSYSLGLLTSGGIVLPFQYTGASGGFLNNVSILPPTTLVANQTAPLTIAATGTLPVYSTAGFPKTGTLVDGAYLITYTGITPTTFTGCALSIITPGIFTPLPYDKVTFYGSVTPAVNDTVQTSFHDVQSVVVTTTTNSVAQDWLLCFDNDRTKIYSATIDSTGQVGSWNADSVVGMPQPPFFTTYASNSSGVSFQYKVIPGPVSSTIVAYGRYYSVYYGTSGLTNIYQTTVTLVNGVLTYTPWISSPSPIPNNRYVLQADVVGSNLMYIMDNYYSGQVAISCVTTSGSASITAASLSTVISVDPGTPVTGTGIPSGTTVIQTTGSGGGATLSANATASGTVTLTFFPSNIYNNIGFQGISTTNTATDLNINPFFQQINQTSSSGTTFVSANSSGQGHFAPILGGGPALPGGTYTTASTGQLPNITSIPNYVWSFYNNDGSYTIFGLAYNAVTGTSVTTSQVTAYDLSWVNVPIYLPSSITLSPGVQYHLVLNFPSTNKSNGLNFPILKSNYTTSKVSKNGKVTYSPIDGQGGLDNYMIPAQIWANGTSNLLALTDVDYATATPSTDVKTSYLWYGPTTNQLQSAGEWADNVRSLFTLSYDTTSNSLITVNEIDNLDETAEYY